MNYDLTRSWAILVSNETGPIVSEQLSDETHEEFVTRVSRAKDIFYFIEAIKGYQPNATREVIRDTRPH